MKKFLLYILILFFVFLIFGIFLNRGTFSISKIKVIEASIVIQPQIILPGDPILITVNSTSTVKEITFDNKKLKVFNYNEKPSVLVGIDLNEKVLKHNIKVKLSNGSELSKLIIIKPREKIIRPLGIPEKLGGNTVTAEKILLSNLDKENFIINNIKTATTSLWLKSFTKSLAELTVTDDYGYSRKTVNSTISHKGTDFHAVEGTSVMAMNDGIVRVSKEFTVYGNTIIIDHGLGLQTLYMHLSKINVKEGDMVKRGDIIGLSGKTGYADQPHLHISVKINSISIDPVVFLGLFNQ